MATTTPAERQALRATTKRQTTTTPKRAAAETDGTYLLRGIDRDLWDKFSLHAASDGIDMRAAILMCVRGYVSGRIELVAQTKGGGK